MEEDRVINHLHTIADSGDILAVKWNPDDSHLATACADGTVKIYASSSGNFIRTLNCRLTADPMPVTALQWRPPTSQTKTKNVLVATTADGGVLHWHATSGKILHTIRFDQENQVFCVDYDLEGKYFAVGSKDMSVRVYDESTKTIIAEMQPGWGDVIGHGNRIFSVKWRDENTIISAGWDNNIIIWDVRAQRAVRAIFGPHICGDSMDICENKLLTGSYNIKDQLQLWDLNTGHNIFTQTVVSNSRPCLIYTAQFSKSDMGTIIAAGGSGSDEAYFYDSETLRPFGILSNLTHAVYSIDFAHTSNKLAVASGDGSIRVFEIAKNRQD
ncbi:unnamed protein product [Blepharisma stoltei]|uniref:Anaphase-promoting complex subunit 4-like WD40 domain-containing protein n=1 Tax=Blepharisma stoltei TaxID=1481888 RepID=A0AAU9JJ15_9CILI|nr:unnamed protein product [Blepharisma stoltei]